MAFLVMMQLISHLMADYSIGGADVIYIYIIFKC